MGLKQAHRAAGSAPMANRRALGKGVMPQLFGVLILVEHGLAGQRVAIVKPAHQIAVLAPRRTERREIG